MRLHRFIPLALLPVALLPLAALTACGSDESTAAAVQPTSAETAVLPETDANGLKVVVIDVRTPAEYEMGHLSGALNLDLEGGQLEAALDDLDPNASYVVYCRSGNRSAVATQLMQAQGITTIQDLGPLDNAASVTGLDVITGSAP